MCIVEFIRVTLSILLRFIIKSFFPVSFKVGGLTCKCKVVGMVVKLVPVDVMHSFKRLQRPAEFLFHNESMFENPDSLPHSDKSIPIMICSCHSHINSYSVSMCLCQAFVQSSSASVPMPIAYLKNYWRDSRVIIPSPIYHFNFFSNV